MELFSLLLTPLLVIITSNTKISKFPISTPIGLIWIDWWTYDLWRKSYSARTLENILPKRTKFETPVSFGNPNSRENIQSCDVTNFGDWGGLSKRVQNGPCRPRTWPGAPCALRLVRVCYNNCFLVCQPNRNYAYAHVNKIDRRTS